MAKRKRRAARKRWLTVKRVKQFRDRAAGESSDSDHIRRLREQFEPTPGTKPLAVSDIIEMVAAAAVTLRSCRARITELEIENASLKNQVSRMIN